jgi:hypothetical protein
MARLDCHLLQLEEKSRALTLPSLIGQYNHTEKHKHAEDTGAYITGERNNAKYLVSLSFQKWVSFI